METVTCEYISTDISHERERFRWDIFVLCVLVYFYNRRTLKSLKNQLEMWICFYLRWLLCWWSECEPRDLTLQSHWPARCFREGPPAPHASHLGLQFSLVGVHIPLWQEEVQSPLDKHTLYVTLVFVLFC